MRNIIFDLDGTLVDSVPGIQWSVETAMRNCGISGACPDLTPLIGPPVRTILGTAAGTDNWVDLDRLEKAFRTSYDGDGWRRTLCQPGVREMLSQLQAAGCILWILTNKPAHATRLILCELRLDAYFREMVSRDSVTPSYASKGAMLTDLLDRRALPRAESILIGDTLEDCHAASAAGIACAVVPHGYGREMDRDLPEGSRRIAGWDELVHCCTGTGVIEVSPPRSALMGKRETSNRL
jgi:phosphoglycolate phosphatase